MPSTTGDMRPPSLGDAVNGVRWDFDPSQRLLSPLVETARYFAHFPWEGESLAAQELPDGRQRLAVIAEDLEDHHDRHREHGAGDPP